MEQNKGKPVTTSVPSISIKFHANVEQLEELHASDEEQGTDSSTAATSAVSEPESSPLKLFPRLVKRSTSIDITPNTAADSSPPTDPWRFFSDIRGKITKSVEEKITEIKSRNNEEGSPLRSKAVVKDSKDNSSVSDSEEMSESSISKTCGIVSTTEGVEMSSDDDAASMEADKEKKPETPLKSTPSSIGSGLRQRFRLLKQKTTPKEGTINTNTLSKIYNINTEKIEQALPEDLDIESGVDVLEDSNLQSNTETETKILKSIENLYDNIEVDDENVVNVKEIHGSDIKHTSWGGYRPKVVFAPVGFVDMRADKTVQQGTYVPLIMLFVSGLMYYLIHRQSTYIAGLLLGMAVTYFYYYVKSLLDSPSTASVSISGQETKEIFKIPSIKEHQPVAKYEGWVNELPEAYNAHTYHINQTQSVFLRLQGNLLRVSHTKSKVPKRALWNEPKVKAAFTHHRVYNLLGAKVSLLPEGLAKKRHWSKKYPICIALSFKSQMDFEASASFMKVDDEEEESKEEKSSKRQTKPKRSFGFKKKSYPVLSQRFSKLTEEEEEYEFDSDNSRASTPSPEIGEQDDATNKAVDQALIENLAKDEENEGLPFEDEYESLPDDWSNITSDESPTETRLYIFGRTDRDKEDWFRKLTTATHKGACANINETSDLDSTASDTLIQKAMNEGEYLKYMLLFNTLQKPEANKNSSEEDPYADTLWMNVLIGRVLFDCLRDDNFTRRLQDRIQRKLASIKLPYFIEELLITELSLGKTPPLIHKPNKPVLDERGVWVDVDVTYEGMIAVIIHTKLNLMKLKQPHMQDSGAASDRSAMFNSDVDDSAESTSDEEGAHLLNPPVLDSAGVPVPGLGGASNASKKIMKMVDKIAESKFFQAATENKYIKKAMEGVSNTDLKLRVELKELVGTLVLNIPPPPSDRVWVGFRPTPNIALSAQPIVGERNITYLRITSWIEKKLLQEFQKLMVIPNMEDFTIPVMSPQLPQ